MDSTITARMSSKQTWALALSSIGSFMVALDALVVTTALSTIRLRLGASIEQLEWTVIAYTLSFAVLLMTGSALGDRFGRRRMFVVGLAIFALASSACALSPNIVWLIVARAIQGTGAALVMPLAVTLLSAAIPPEHRGRAFGLFSGTAGLAVLSGPVVGGAIAQGIAWQWIFWLNVPIGLATIPLVLGRIEESYGPRTPLDIRGMLLLSGAVLGIVWGLVRGNIAGWGSTEVITTLAAGVLLAVGFVFWELRARAPMLPMRLFRSRVFTAGNASGFLFFASLYGSAFFLAQFLQTVQGDSPFGAGLRLLPWTVMLFATAPISGALINRVGERYLMVIAMLLQGIAMAWIGLVARPGVAYLALVVPLIVAGFGAAAIPTAQNAVISAVVPGAIGKASGTFSMLRQLGGAFGVAILAAVFSHAGSFHSAQAFSDGFSPAMVVSATFSLLGACAGLLLPRRRSAVVEVVDTPKQSAPLAETVGMGAGGN